MRLLGCRAAATASTCSGILTRPGTDPAKVADAVRAQLGASGLRTLTGTKRGDAESPDDALSREDIVAGLTVFAILASFVAIFVVASTFSLSVQQRHRELALFRAIGSTPRQVRRLVAGEALVISLVAVAARVAAERGGRVPREGPLRRGRDDSAGPARRRRLAPALAGLGAAIVTTQLAAFVSARRASRIRPTDALREATVQARPISWLRAVVGLAAFLARIAVVLLAARNSAACTRATRPPPRCC